MRSSLTVLSFRHNVNDPYAPPMTFGDRLVQMRKQRGLTQTELGRGLGADGADIGKQVIAGWENNRYVPRLEQFAKLCDRLHCSADVLLFGRAVPVGVSTEVLELSDIADRLPLQERSKLFFLWKEIAAVYEQRNGANHKQANKP